MPETPDGGGARVSRRALVDIIRPAAAGSYGVTGFVADGLGERLLAWLRLREPGIRVSLADGLAVELEITVAYGLPVAEVARQAESAVRYALRRALDREVDRVVVHVGGMRYGSGVPILPESEAPGAVGVAEGLRVPPDVLGAPPVEEDLLDLLGRRESEAGDRPGADGA